MLSPHKKDGDKRGTDNKLQRQENRKNIQEYWIKYKTIKILKQCNNITKCYMQ